mmetsp:Transcript_70945/g.203299  ORF Transcript_70945/g.203299 Transcript_70945/m.203299 type:complete len:108 (+) Transcript_70945:166-489(+)
MAARFMATMKLHVVPNRLPSKKEKNFGPSGRGKLSSKSLTRSWLCLLTCLLPHSLQFLIVRPSSVQHEQVEFLELSAQVRLRGTKSIKLILQSLCGNSWIKSLLKLC